MLKRIYDFFGIKTWTTADGRVIPVKQLTDNHLQNIIKYFANRCWDKWLERSAIERDWCPDGAFVDDDTANTILCNVIVERIPQIVAEAERRRFDWHKLVEDRGIIKIIIEEADVQSVGHKRAEKKDKKHQKHKKQDRKIRNRAEK